MDDAANGRKLIEVAIERPVPHTFTYWVPDELRERALSGARVLVPFGRRAEIGTIVSEAKAPSPEREAKLKAIDDVLDSEPTFPPDLLKLLLWASRYYLAAPGLCFKAALPPGLNPRALVEASLVAPGGQKGLGELAPMEQKLLAELHGGPRRVDALARDLGKSGLYRALGRLEDLGLLELQRRFKGRRRRLAPESLYRVAVTPAELELELEHSRSRRAPRRAEVLEWLGALQGEPFQIGALRSAVGAYGAKLFKELLEQGFLLPVKTMESEFDGPEAPHPLMPEQSKVVGRLAELVSSREFSTLLLQGVTGSGKTEVYLRAAAAARDQGLSALFLVPEIGLTPLLLARVRRRFAGGVAVLHSGLTEAERLAQWRRIHRGGVDLIVGARSAIFAPIRRLGIIIVDEEHDSSYKQDSGHPHYHGRDLAVVRGRICSCPVILGSATPTLESRYNCQIGKYELYRLDRRVKGLARPTIEIVDLRSSRARGSSGTLISPRLRDEIEKRLKKREQVILLLNRRGFSTVLLCEECGDIVGCDHCSVTMTFHRQGSVLRCHMCGAVRSPPPRCPACQHPVIDYKGMGTQRLQEELRRLFPEASTGRMDRDSTRGRNGHERILSQFSAGKLDILVGTQMLAKGHHFPKVTLVGIVGADQIFSIADFRAAERAFQLFTQAAGRAGRSALGGHVIIETYRADHPVIRHCRTHDYEAFFIREMEFRKGFSLPPFSRLTNITLSAKRAEAVEKVAHELAHHLRVQLATIADVIGPAFAPVARIKDHHRFHILLRTQRPMSFVSRLARCLGAFRLSGGVRIDTDVDPVAIL